MLVVLITLYVVNKVELYARFTVISEFLAGLVRGRDRACVERNVTGSSPGLSENWPLTSEYALLFCLLVLRTGNRPLETDRIKNRRPAKLSGFVTCVDICNPMYRLFDDALIQFRLVTARFTTCTLRNSINDDGRVWLSTCPHPVSARCESWHWQDHWLLNHPVNCAHLLFVNINSSSPRTYLEFPDSPRFRFRCRALPSRDIICFVTSSLDSTDEFSSWVFSFHLFRNLLAGFYRRVFFMNFNVPSISSLVPADDLSSWDF